MSASLACGDGKREETTHPEKNLPRHPTLCRQDGIRVFVIFAIPGIFPRAVVGFAAVSGSRRLGRHLREVFYGDDDGVMMLMNRQGEKSHIPAIFFSPRVFSFPDVIFSPSGPTRGKKSDLQKIPADYPYPAPSHTFKN